MKKIIVLFLMLSSCLLAQDLSRFPTTNSSSDTLKTSTSQDSIDVSFRSDLGFSSYTISAYTTTGTDTVKVYVLSTDASVWAQEGLIDLSDYSYVSQIIVTTTPKAFQLFEVPDKIRLITADYSASTVYTISGR